MLLRLLLIIVSALGLAAPAQAQSNYGDPGHHHQHPGLRAARRARAGLREEVGPMVKTIAVGSGQAMTMGEKGEADVLLVHSPARKSTWRTARAQRRLVMHNDFVIVGPAADPAKIKGHAKAADALKASPRRRHASSRAATTPARTAKKGLWKAAGIEPEGAWYSGPGRHGRRRLASPMTEGLYTLADRGTYLAMKKTSPAHPRRGGEELLNVYHVIEVNQANGRRSTRPAPRPSPTSWSRGDPGRIKTFGVEKFGAPLFVPTPARRSRL